MADWEYQGEGGYRDIRAKALKPDDSDNPYLFPSPRGGGRPNRNVLYSLCKQVHRHVGVQINPHLYRHLVGWIWLRDCPEALPLVKQLLNHKSIETTMKYYAQIADQTAVAAWQKFVPNKVGTPS